MITTTLPLLLVAALPVADPHSLANPAEVRPAHAALELDVRFGDRALHGRVDLTLAYPRGPEAADHLDLDTRDLTVESVTDPGSGRPLPFTLGDPVPLLGRRLRVTLPEPRPKAVRVAWTTSPGASALQWLEPAQTTSKKHPYLFTQSQAIHARSWIPCADSPGARLTFEAVVRVPPGMTAVMAAEALEHEPAKGVFRFRMPQPIPPYLFALAVGEIAFRPLGPRTGVYAEPAVLERAAAEFEDMEKMVEATERLYGPYAWGRWDVLVLPPSFPYGGMENPRLTFATPTVIAGDKSLVGLLAHELAHSWSGNLVTNATWSDFWLNEGFTTYLTARITEAVYGREQADMQVLLGQRRIREHLESPRTRPEGTVLYRDLAGEDPDESVGPIAYDKGANFLRVLESHFGRGAFDAFLRRYFEAHRFQSMTTPGFLAILKRDLVEGALWDRLQVEAWVHGPGLPDNLVVPESKRLARTRSAADAFARTGSLDGVARDWVTAEWQDFLGALPPGLTREQMAALDARCGFSRSGNAEVLSAWLLHVARNAYEPSYAVLESFLSRQGRVKYLRPLYQALLDNPKTRALAREIYAKARPGYHPIATTAIDADLAKAPAASGAGG